MFTEKALLTEINSYSKNKTLEKDEVLIHPGEKVLFIPIVQKGVLRIVREDEEGREFFLYHLYPGQTCAMAINCCQSGRNSMVKAIAEDHTEILLIPTDRIEDWFRFSEWKAYVNNTYHLRFTELLNVIDLIAFSNMDKQLLHYLQERSKALHTHKLEITQQQIADELHTHREAIGRLLRTMEQKGIVKLGRNTIELLLK